MSCLARIHADIRALPHDESVATFAARVALHINTSIRILMVRGRPLLLVVARPPNQSGANANANARDIRDTNLLTLLNYNNTQRAALVDNFPLPPTSFAGRRAGQQGMRAAKSAAIVIS